MGDFLDGGKLDKFVVIKTDDIKRYLDDHGRPVCTNCWKP